MNATHHQFRLQDVPQCLELLERDPFLGGLADAPHLRADLPALWRELLNYSHVRACVIEDADLPAGRQVIGFAMSVFVTEEFVCRERAAPAPGLTGRLLEAHRRGGSPVLSRAEVRRAGPRRGLFVVHPHVVFAQTLSSSADWAAACEQTTLSFLRNHRGYRFQEFLTEIDEVSLSLAESWGLRRRADCTEFYRRAESESRTESLPTEQRSWLVGLTRGEAVEYSENIFSFAFRHAPPRLGLRPAEQSLLDLALEGMTDSELAQELNLSIWTVKKRWQGIYARVAGAAPKILNALSAPTVSEGEDSAASSHRRRLLLNYLRVHSEELAPGAA